MEDHGDTRRTLLRLLSHFGHEVSVADFVATALDVSGSKEFDALLSDIGLPDGTGYEVVVHVKKQQPVKDRADRIRQERRCAAKQGCRLRLSSHEAGGIR